MFSFFLFNHFPFYSIPIFQSHSLLPNGPLIVAQLYTYSFVKPWPTFLMERMRQVSNPKIIKSWSFPQIPWEKGLFSSKLLPLVGFYLLKTILQECSRKWRSPQHKNKYCIKWKNIKIRLVLDDWAYIQAKQSKKMYLKCVFTLHYQIW